MVKVKFNSLFFLSDRPVDRMLLAALTISISRSQLLHPHASRSTLSHAARSTVASVSAISAWTLGTHALPVDLWFPHTVDRCPLLAQLRPLHRIHMSPWSTGDLTSRSTVALPTTNLQFFFLSLTCKNHVPMHQFQILYFLNKNVKAE